MRMCTKCLQEKRENDFFVKDKASGRLHAQCKSCYKEHRKTYSVEHYRKYGDAYRLRAKIRRAIVRKDLQSKMLEYLSGKSCVICGEADIRTFEFDHLHPENKTFSIAKGMTDGKKWDEILSEIKKCRILCANCHKKHTASQRNWYKLLAE